MFIVNVQEKPEEPTVLEMTPFVRVVIFVMIGVYDLVICALLVSLYIYRTNPAVMLAQGSFLSGLLMASLVCGTFIFTFMPEKRWYCISWGPLVLLPFTVMAAILVARLWRVYVTLSGAIQLGRIPGRTTSISSQERRRSSLRFISLSEIGTWNLLDRMVDVLSFLAKLPLLTTFCQRGNQPNPDSVRGVSLRRTATGVESVQLVIFLILPQALLQTVGSIVRTPTLQLVLDDSERVGRYYCKTDAKDWVSVSGALFATSVYALALILAWQGRAFPSIFNEKDSIFSAAMTSAFVLLISNVSHVNCAFATCLQKTRFSQPTSFSIDGCEHDRRA